MRCSIVVSLLALSATSALVPVVSASPGVVPMPHRYSSDDNYRQHEQEEHQQHQQQQQHLLTEGDGAIQNPTGCHGGLCGGMADYPVGKGGTQFYSEFDVPGKPEVQDGICYYIYFNIFFSGKGHGTMNQFVPQLMLGNSLTNSSGQYCQYHR